MAKSIRLNTRKHMAGRIKYRNTGSSNSQNRRLMHYGLFRELGMGDVDHSDDTISDKSKNSNEGTMVNFDRNNGTVSGGVTIDDSSMIFDGSTGYVSIPNNTDYSSLDFSVSCRVKVGSLGSNIVILSQEPQGSGRNILYVTNNGEWANSLGGSAQKYTQITDAVVGQEYNIVVTKSGNEITINVDGESQAKTITMESASGNFRIGAGPNGSSNWDGSITHVRLYNKSLSPPEVIQEANSGTYSTITDGSLIGQRTGKDFDGTEALPTTIYDTNMIVRGFNSSPTYQTGIPTGDEGGIVNGGVTIDDGVISLDGSTGYLNTDKLIPTDAYSISTKFNMASLAGSNFILDARSGASAGVILYVKSTSNELAFLHNAVELVGPVLSVGVDYKINITYDGTNLSLYVNGSEYVSKASITASAGTNAYIGTRRTLTPLNYVNGIINYVRLYNKGLTASEIAIEDNLEIYSNMTDGSLIAQYTGSDFDGTVALPTSILNSSGVADISNTNEVGISFDGINDRISNTVTDFINKSKPFSVSVKLRTGGVKVSGSNYENFFCHSDSSSDRLVMGLRSGKICVGVYNGSSYVGVVTKNYDENTEYHIVYNYDGNGNGTMFINLEQAYTSSPTPTSGGGGSFFFIGGENDSRAFDGIIYDYQTFSKELNEGAISRLYNNIPLG